IGVREHARDDQSVISCVVEVGAEGSTREPLPPEQSQPLLAEGIEGGDGRGGREYAEVGDGLPREPRRIAVRDRRHEVAPDVAVQDVQAVEGEEQSDEQREEPTRATYT